MTKMINPKLWEFCIFINDPEYYDGFNDPSNTVSFRLKDDPEGNGHWPSENFPEIEEFFHNSYSTHFMENLSENEYAIHYQNYGWHPVNPSSSKALLKGLGFTDVSEKYHAKVKMDKIKFDEYLKSKQTTSPDDEDDGGYCYEYF